MKVFKGCVLEADEMPSSHLRDYGDVIQHSNCKCSVPGCANLWRKLQLKSWSCDHLILKSTVSKSSYTCFLELNPIWVILLDLYRIYHFPFTSFLSQSFS